jgi:3-methyl-2-oxobutanoate hydroxymethyltransferase
MAEKVTILDLYKAKRQGRKLTMLTAYDFPMASLVDRAGVDIVLVGDSVANVVLGYDSTLPITMDEMLHHARAVRRGVKRAFLVGDMPFMSYQASIEEAVRNAGRFMKEAGCEGVKLEGGLEILDKTRAIIDAGIAVMGHIGLTPQSVSKLGGYRVQGKDAKTAKKLIEAAVELEKAGCFCLILECVPDRVAAIISDTLQIPVVGIGAGSACDGQVLVVNDMLGMYGKFLPKFVKQYAQLARDISRGLEQFKKEVENGKFPQAKHSFSIEDSEFKKLKNALRAGRRR